MTAERMEEIRRRAGFVGSRTGRELPEALHDVRALATMDLPALLSALDALKAGR